MSSTSIGFMRRIAVRAVKVLPCLLGISSDEMRYVFIGELRLYGQRTLLSKSPWFEKDLDDDEMVSLVIRNWKDGGVVRAC